MQTAYSLKMSAAKEGLLADNGPKDIVHGTAATALLVGKFVAMNSSTEVPKHPTAAAEITGLKRLGVIIASHDCEQSGESSDQVAAQKPASILQKGRIWVKPEDPENFAVGMQCSIRYAGTGDKGAFVCTPVTDETALLPESRFLEIQGDLALVEIL
jgi:hypothetical protein